MITDLTYLRSMSNNDSSFLREMVDIFREQIAEYAVQLPELNKNKEYDTLSKVAHKAKSSVSVMGMTKEADLLKELELNAAEGRNPEEYDRIIQAVLEQAHAALDELEEQLKSN